jgi:hypothetical protein
MRATEILRGILDIIDDIEDQQGQELQVSEPVATAEIHNDEERRMNQIKDLLPTARITTVYANSPIEAVADIESVTTDAGGGTNGPKHPHDLRGNSFPLYKG